MRRVTLSQVAERAGVSPAAASHVLRGLERGTIRVSEATQAAVRAAAAELGYVPSAAARGLAAGSAGRVAILVPNLQQPYFARIAESLAVALEVHGLTTTLRLSRTPESERDAVLGRTTRDVDGVIVCPHFITAELLEGRTPPLPVVQVGGSPTDGIDCVVMSEYEGALAAARHLLASGRRRIAYIADPWLDSTKSQRHRGYLDAHAELGLEPDPRLQVAGSDWDRRETGQEAVIGLFRTGVAFDGIMCVNDAVASGAMRAISRAGLRIPEDVAITGFDNTDEGAFMTPPLTSVDPGAPEMAGLAVSMLRSRLDGDRSPARREMAATQLVVRSSTLAQRTA